MVNSIILSGVAWASSLKDAIMSRVGDERGQDFVEDAVLIGAIGIAGAVALMGAGAAGWLDFAPFRNKIADCLSFDSSGLCSG